MEKILIKLFGKKPKIKNDHFLDSLPEKDDFFDDDNFEEREPSPFCEELGVSYDEVHDFDK